MLDFHPNLWVLFSAHQTYAEMHGLPIRFTSLRSDRSNVKSSSTTHEESPIRAYDSSLEGWPEIHLRRIEFLLNKYYSKYAAISASDLQPRAIIIHNIGYGKHAHVQCNRKLVRNNKFEL